MNSMTPSGEVKGVLPLREQARWMNERLKQRLETVLPGLMKREDLDMWVVVTRENNDDPVAASLLPGPVLSGDLGLVLPPSRRLTILLFHLLESGVVERLCIGGVGLQGPYQEVWDHKEDQWECLARTIRERSPQSIALNYSESWALADGMSHSQYERLMQALGPLSARVRSAEPLVIGWLEQRTPGEMAIYPAVVQIAHGIIREAFSLRAIHPGETTADDLAWWIRQRIRDLGLAAWFHPTIMIQRRGATEGPVSGAILPGDMLHCDVGLHYLGLATDHQHLAYVLRPGENDAPAGLKSGMSSANCLQDILAGEFAVGRSGNAILAAALRRARAEGLKAMIYTHPLGFHGHGAGPTIGLWDCQGGVPGRGDYPLHDDTCYALELNVKQAVPEWDGQEVTFYLEETVAFSRGRVSFLDGRQEALHLIGNEG